MHDDGFDLTMWTVPHHAHIEASLVYVDSDLVADGLPGGAIQLRSDLGDLWSREPFFVLEQPHRTFAVTKSDLAELASLLEAASLQLGHRTRSHALGETVYGFRLSRDFREVSVCWSGRIENEFPSLAKLFHLVNALSSHQ